MGGILFPWEVPAPDFKALWGSSGSEVRQELHPVPAVGLQRVTVIKTEGKGCHHCLQPPGRGCSFSFPPWCGWRLLFPQGAGMERMQSSHSTQQPG